MRTDRQRENAYSWWKENQECDFDSMAPREFHEWCVEQDKLYLIWTDSTQRTKHKKSAVPVEKRRS